MKKLITILSLFLCAHCCYAEAKTPAPLQIVNFTNNTACPIQVVAYATDMGSCPVFYASIVYVVAPFSVLSLDAYTITWVGAPTNPFTWMFIAADVADDGYGSCPNGTMPTTCAGGDDVCNVGDGSCGYLPANCFIIGNSCSSCKVGTIVNATCAFSYPTTMDIVVN